MTWPSRTPTTITLLLSLLVLATTAGCLVDQPANPSSASPPPPRPAVGFAASASALQRFEYHAIKLGSDYNLVLYAPDKPAADAAAEAASAEVDRLDHVFSDYKPDSELSKLSRLTQEGPMAQPTAISEDLYAVLKFSQAVSESTAGAFDLTVGPYVQLWRRSRRQQQLPTPERLAEAKAAVGWKLVELAADRPAVRLGGTKMRLDAGGVATGYISDKVLDVLRKRGLPIALVDLSGDLAVGDPPPGRAGWTVAIRDLTEPSKTANYIEVANCGVSTSGDTYRFVEIDGVRYSHILDPKTGLGLTRRLGVTTVAPTGVAADVMATAVSVLGPDEGLKWVDRVSGSDGPFKGAGARVTAVAADGAVNVTESERYKRIGKAAATRPAR